MPITEPALTGEVLELVGGRWRVVLLGERIPVTDRRRLSTEPRPPTFGPGSQKPRKPTERPNPHTTAWRPR